MGYLPELGWGEKTVLFAISLYGVHHVLGTHFMFAYLLGTLTLQYILAKKRLRVWKNLGVPGPKPALWLGNILQMIQLGGMHQSDVKWTAQYGKFCGTYIFGQPDLLISDLDILKRVLVEDFSNFANRAKVITAVIRGIRSKESNRNDSRTYLNLMLTVLRGRAWKDIRHTVTPIFSSGKIKQMIPVVEKSCHTLVDILQEKADCKKSFDAKKVLGAFTFDVTSVLALATDIDSQRNPGNPFVKYAGELFEMSYTNWRVFLNYMFVWTFVKLDTHFGLRLTFDKGENFFRSYLTAVIDHRKKDGKKSASNHTDLLQLLMNVADEERQSEKYISGENRAKLTDAEILAQCFLFLIAGYDTTATTLTFCAYSLATNPHTQEKCRQEVFETTGRDGPISWDALQTLPYLEATICETLRVYPPACRFDRLCSKDYRLTDTITIPKGASISVPVYAIHHSSENYDNPEEFRPERFLPEEKAERNPLLWLPFGYGPRNCIGMRFALCEMKLCLAILLRKFRFVPCEQTEKPPLKLQSMQILRPVTPIQLGIESI